MADAPMPGQVEKLRDLLTEANVYWAPVRDYPLATYIPGDPTDKDKAAASLLTIWWQGPALSEFVWGHDFEYHDATAEEVITRLKELRHE